MADARLPFHRILGRARRAAGLTQSKVAEQIGASQPAISLYESGRNDALSKDKIQKLARLLEVEYEGIEVQEPDRLLPTTPTPTPARLFYCPNPFCGGASVFMFGDELVVRPFIVSADGGAESLWCKHCGETLEQRCGKCKREIVNGNYCPGCGQAYVESGALREAERFRTPESLRERMRRDAVYRAACETPIERYDAGGGLERATD